MLKKTILSTALLTIANTSYAGIFYMGPSLQYESIKSNSSSFTTLSPRLTAGYAERLDFPFYIAGEIFAEAGNIQGHPDGSPLKNTPSFGVTALPGYMISNDTFGYLRAGVIATDFSGADSYKWGAQGGIGIETAVTETWDVRAEYIYTKYQSIDSVGSPYSNAVALGVIHRFK